jgi:hypothetical protein
MAKQRTDTESVINLVINGKQAMTSLSQLTDAQRRLTSEFRHMSELDPQYPRTLRQLQAINAAVTEQRNLMRGVDNEAKKLKESWLEITAGVAGGNILSDIVQGASSAVTEFVAGAKAAYAEAEQGQAQLQAVLKSTDGVSGKTKAQLDALSQSIMNLTGVDDDVITKSESLLLTFTNIRGEIFDQTLPAIVDMTAAMNNGNVSMDNIQKTTIQVGKALNDPIKGMTALSKVGVSFTEEQKKAVKQMVATNDVAGAQKLILAELSKEFGGMGEALAATDTGAELKMATRLGNIQESLGGLITKGKASFIQFFSPLVGWLERATETRLSDTLEKDRISLMANIVQLQASNTSHAKRLTIINDLKAQYPAYLKQIDAEKVSNGNLLPVLQEINKALVMKIAFQKKNEDLNHSIEDEAEAFLRLDKASNQLSMTLAAIMERAKDKGIKIVMPKDLTDLQQADFLIRKLNASKGNSSGFNVDMNVKDIDMAATTVKQLDNAYKSAGQSSQKLLEAQTAFANKNGLSSGGNTKTMEENTVITGTGGGASAPTGGGGKSNKQIEEAKKAKELYKDLLEETAKLGVQQSADQLSKNMKEIEQEGWKYNELIKKEQDFLNMKGATQKQKDDIQSKIDQLETDKKNAQNAIVVRQEGERNKAIDDLRSKLSQKLETELQKEKDLINQQYDSLEKDAAGNADAIAALKIARSKDLTAAELREKQRLEDEKLAIESKAYGLSGDTKASKLAKIKKDYDDEVSALKKKYSEELQATQEFKDALAAIEKNRKAEETSLATGEDKDDEKAKKDAILGSAQAVSDAVFTIAANNRKRETDIALNELDRQRQAELANKNLTDKQKEQINARYDAKVKAEKLKAWQADKRAALAQAVISGALAVVKALPNVALAIASGVAAAAQIAVIVAQKPPEFAVGVRDFEGGPAVVGEKGNELINENGKMWLATSRTMANLPKGTDVYTASQTSGILANTMYPNFGYELDSQGALSAERNYRFNAGNSSQSSPSIGSTTSTSAKESSDMALLLDKFDEMIVAQREANDKKLSLVYTDLEAFQEEVVKIRYAQGE